MEDNFESYNEENDYTSSLNKFEQMLKEDAINHDKSYRFYTSLFSLKLLQQERKEQLKLNKLMNIHFLYNKEKMNNLTKHNFCHKIWVSSVVWYQNSYNNQNIEKITQMLVGRKLFLFASYAYM